MVSFIYTKDTGCRKKLGETVIRAGLDTASFSFLRDMSSRQSVIWD